MNEIITLDGNIFATNFNRVVRGQRGSYIEFEKEHIIPILVDYFEPTRDVDNIYYIWKTPVFKCRIIEDKDPGYPSRTYRNALADITLVFAIDYTTSGELCTKKAVFSQNKMYQKATSDTFQYIIDSIVSLKKSEVTINIAGNGMYTFNKYNVTQDRLNYEVHTYLEQLKISLENRDIKISLIRSGGQTGADEAGILAAIKLGIPALIVCPNGYRYRTINENIANKESFCNRFPYLDQDIKVYHQLKTVAYAAYKVGKYYVSPDQFLNFKDPEQLF